MVNLPDRFVWEITNSLIPSSNLNGSDTMAQQKRRTLPPKNTRRNAEALGIDLDCVSKRLFVEARDAFEDGRVAIDKTDAENPVVKIEYKNRQVEMPVNKNLLRIDGVESELEGVVVHIPNTDKAYIPLQAVHAVTGKKGKLPSVSR